LSYATVERKREKRAKVDGGSSIEVISAGSKDGNMSKIIINNEQIFAAASSTSAASLSGATMSSNYRKGDIGKAAA
jgi:hypothetical protein